MEKVKVEKGQKLAVVLSNGKEIIFEGREEVLVRPLKNGWKEELRPWEYRVYNDSFSDRALKRAFYEDGNWVTKYPVVTEEPQLYVGVGRRRCVGVISARRGGLRASFSNMYLFGWGETKEERARRKGRLPHIEDDGVLYWGEERLGRIIFYISPNKNRINGIIAVVVPEEEIPSDSESKKLLKDLGSEVFELEDLARNIAQGVMSALAAIKWIK